HDLVPNHEADTPNLPYVLGLVGNPLEFDFRLLPQCPHPLQQVRPLDVVDRGRPGRHPERVPPVGPEVEALLQPLVVFRPVRYEGERNPRSNRLRYTDDVRVGPRQLASPELSSSPEPCLHLVDNQRDLVPLSDLSQSREKVFRRDDVPPFALDRLDQYASYVAQPGVVVLHEMLEISDDHLRFIALSLDSEGEAV